MLRDYSSYPVTDFPRLMSEERKAESSSLRVWRVGVLSQVAFSDAAYSHGLDGCLVGV